MALLWHSAAAGSGRHASAGGKETEPLPMLAPDNSWWPPLSEGRRGTEGRGRDLVYNRRGMR